jgi:hypothetical protein
VTGVETEELGDALELDELAAGVEAGACRLPEARVVTFEPEDCVAELVMALFVVVVLWAW